MCDHQENHHEWDISRKLPTTNRNNYVYHNSVVSIKRAIQMSPIFSSAMLTYEELYLYIAARCRDSEMALFNYHGICYTCQRNGKDMRACTIILPDGPMSICEDCVSIVNKMRKNMRTSYIRVANGLRWNVCMRDSPENGAQIITDNMSVSCVDGIIYTFANDAEIYLNRIMLPMSAFMAPLRLNNVISCSLCDAGEYRVMCRDCAEFAIKLAVHVNYAKYMQLSQIILLPEILDILAQLFVNIARSDWPIIS